MTSAFAQHKLVQKPSKQHRFDCLPVFGVKIEQSRVAHLNFNDTQHILLLHIILLLLLYYIWIFTEDITNISLSCLQTNDRK